MLEFHNFKSVVLIISLCLISGNHRYFSSYWLS